MLLLEALFFKKDDFDIFNGVTIDFNFGFLQLLSISKVGSFFSIFSLRFIPIDINCSDYVTEFISDSSLSAVVESYYL